MSVWAILYAYSDHEAILKYAMDSLEDVECEPPPTHWGSPHYPKLWSALGDVPRLQREEMGIAGVVNCVTGDDQFIEMVYHVDSSIDSWCRIDGLPEGFEQLISLMEGDPCQLEIPLRRAIASCALGPRLSEGKAQDEAWPTVARQRSSYVGAFKEELRELVATLRDLQSKGETHVYMTLG